MNVWTYILYIYFSFLGVPGRNRREIIMPRMNENGQGNTSLHGRGSYPNENRLQLRQLHTNVTPVRHESVTSTRSSQMICLPTPPPPDDNISRTYMDLEPEDRMSNMQFTIPPDTHERVYVPSLTPPSSGSSMNENVGNQSQTLIPRSPPRRPSIPQRAVNYGRFVSQEVVRRATNQPVRTPTFAHGIHSQPVRSCVVATRIPRRRSETSRTRVPDATVCNEEFITPDVQPTKKQRTRSAPSCTIVREPSDEKGDSQSSEVLEYSNTCSTAAPSRARAPQHTHDNVHAVRSTVGNNQLPPTTCGRPSRKQESQECRTSGNTPKSHPPSRSNSVGVSVDSSQSNYSCPKVYDCIPPVASTSRHFQHSHVLRNTEDLETCEYQQHETYEVVNDSIEEGVLGNTNDNKIQMEKKENTSEGRPLDARERETINTVITEVENEMAEIQNRWAAKAKEKEEVEKKIAQNEQEIHEDMILQEQMKRKHEEESKKVNLFI